MQKRAKCYRNHRIFHRRGVRFYQALYLYRGLSVTKLILCGKAILLQRPCKTFRLNFQQLNNLFRDSQIFLSSRFIRYFILSSLNVRLCMSISLVLCISVFCLGSHRDVRLVLVISSSCIFYIPYDLPLCVKLYALVNQWILLCCFVFPLCAFIHSEIV